jgi:hypothetical protein
VAHLDNERNRVFHRETRTEEEDPKKDKIPDSVKKIRGFIREQNLNMSRYVKATKEKCV